MRMIDAAVNRAGEGLRVAEDYVRFVLDDGIPADRLASIDAQVQREVDDATDAAEQSPLAGTDSLFTNVWADGGSTWRN